MSATTDYILRSQEEGYEHALLGSKKLCSWCKGAGYQPDLYHGKIQCRKCLGKGKVK